MLLSRETIDFFLGYQNYANRTYKERKRSHTSDGRKKTPSTPLRPPTTFGRTDDYLDLSSKVERQEERERGVLACYIHQQGFSKKEERLLLLEKPWTCTCTVRYERLLLFHVCEGSPSVSVSILCVGDHSCQSSWLVHGRERWRI